MLQRQSGHFQRLGHTPDTRAYGGSKAKFVMPIDQATGKPDFRKGLKPFGLHVTRTEARKAYEADLRAARIASSIRWIRRQWKPISMI